MPVDEEKLMGYVHQAVGDFGALLCAALINIGDKLNLFQAMAGSGPMTAAELAKKTGTTERYVRSGRMGWPRRDTWTTRAMAGTNSTRSKPWCWLGD